MNRSAIAMAALALVGLAGAGGATVWNITSGDHDYEVNGWALHCEDSGRLFDECEARKSFGPAKVRVRVVRHAMLGQVARACRGGPETAGTEHFWSFERFELYLAAKRIADDASEARRACGKKPLSDKVRLEIHNMFVLLYALRPDTFPGDLGPVSESKAKTE